MKKIISVYLLVLLCLSGCATYSYTDAPFSMGIMYSKYVQIGYEGDLKSIGDVAVVTTDGIVKIISINGEPIESFRLFKKTGLYSSGRYQLHLLPGKHELSLSFQQDNARPTSDLKKSITVTKGQILHLSWVGKRGTWSVKEHEGSLALTTITDDFIELTNNK